MNKEQYGDFSLRALKAVNKLLLTNSSILDGDLAELASSVFQLTDKQRCFFNSAPKEQMKKLQSTLNDVRTNNEHVQLKVMQDDTKRVLFLVPSNASGQLIRNNLVPIVCCDAHCGDWEWC